MRTIDELNVRRLFRRFLDECSLCRALYVDSAHLVLSDQNELTEDQVIWIFIYLNDLHVKFGH